MERWQRALTSSITDLRELADHFSIDIDALEPGVKRYPMQITRYYLGLIKEQGDPIWRQCVPDPLELKNSNLPLDPLNEEGLTPVPMVIHRYPDRVVLMVSSACPTFCRFCMRKHRIGHQEVLKTDIPIEECLNIIIPFM